MRNFCKVSLTLGLAVLVASPAFAQRQRQPRQPGPRGGGNLLTNKSVQEELKITDSQKTKIEEISKKTRDMIQEKLKDVPREERFQKMREVMREVNAKTNKELAGVLKEDQLKRYKQIQLQQTERMRGPAVFTDADVQKALKFTDEQKADVKKVTEDLTKQVREETKDLPRDRESFAKRREITTKLNKEAMGKIASKLTKDQKATWKDMLGKPFEVKFERPMRPGGGGGRPPRPGRVEF